MAHPNRCFCILKGGHVGAGNETAPPNAERDDPKAYGAVHATIGRGAVPLHKAGRLESDGNFLPVLVVLTQANLLGDGALPLPILEATRGSVSRLSKGRRGNGTTVNHRRERRERSSNFHRLCEDSRRLEGAANRRWKTTGQLIGRGEQEGD